jgi:hypothetical protein
MCKINFPTMSVQPTGFGISSAPAPINVVGGADQGVGFHSEQPINIERYDNTEQTHFKNKLDQSEGDIKAEPVQVYPKYQESPFTRYVRRPLSDGVLSKSVTSFALEDRSTMGVPLNPFWIRNDTWSMMNEGTDIFQDAGPNFVAPRAAVQSSVPAGGNDRPAYIENQEQPQVPQADSIPSTLVKTVSAPPMVSAAGSVTGAVVASEKSQMEIPQSNPAIPGQQGTEGKEGELKSTSENDKNGGGAVGAGDAGTMDLASMEDVKPPKKKRAKKVSN